MTIFGFYEARDSCKKRILIKKVYPLEAKSACVIDSTLIYKPIDKEHKVYDDERMSMNSEGKIHRMDTNSVCLL